MGGLILDQEKMQTDAAYREDMRHRFISDWWFACELLGRPMHRVLHAPVAELYPRKNPNLTIPEQHPIKNRMLLAPRLSWKTTGARVEKIQWMAAFPAEITIQNQSATQPLAKEISESIAEVFYCPKFSNPRKLQQLFPELTFHDRAFNYGKEKWNTPGRAELWNTSDDMRDLDWSLSYTSPQSNQTGSHPWIDNADDMANEVNSGIRATAETRQGVGDTYDTNSNKVMAGGYRYLTGTRYHPLDPYGRKLKDMDPAEWQVVIQCAMTRKDGSKLLPGEFPPEDEVVMHFADLPGLDYRSCRSKFYANYETFMCFCAGSRVLMADWTEKPIEELEVGDEVVGLEKNGAYESRLVKTKVVRTFVRTAQAVESTIDGDRKVRHTPDHRFLRPSNGGEMRYLKLRVGSKTISVYKPTPAPTAEQQRDLDWLGGMLDGEGSVQKSIVALSQKEANNPEIFDAVGRTLNRLGIRFTMGKTHETDRFSLLGGRSLLIWLLNHARMAKTKRFHAALWGAKQHSETSGRGGGSSQPKVLAIDPIGEQWVYDIETETHNFVCEGFAVHNCQQQNSPQGGLVQTFDDKLVDGCEIDEDRVPLFGGEVFTCWRLPYGAKPATNRYAEGVCARIEGGKVYIVDCWRFGGTPSHQAEMMVQCHRRAQADGMMVLGTPGSDSAWTLLRNEAAKKSLSLRLHWAEWSDNENYRSAQIKQMEPMMKVGRILFQRATTRASDLREQFVHFGLIEETGLIECVARLADRVPLSQLRANMQEEELEWQRRARERGMLADWLGQAGLMQQGANLVDEQLEQKAMAHMAAMSAAGSWKMPPLPGGLDG